MENKTPEPRKVQTVAIAHYARRDIQQAMFDFCKQREVVGNYNNEFFAKRPDCLDYPQDILTAAKNGVTSFHCSEELWSNPLDINTNMTPDQYSLLRTGWDFLIDIDSKFLDYSKIAARLLIKALSSHGVKNVGIKFSGSKGFHLLIPSKAFPKEYAGELTKNHFPEWPRAIASYLFSIIKDPMNQEILKLSNREKLEQKGELISEHKCPLCGKPAEEKSVSKYRCPNFKCRSEMTSMKANRKQLRCPSCNGNMDKVSEEKILYCSSCNVNTAKIAASKSTIGGEHRESKTSFQEEITTKSAEDSIDIVLVSSRHLFRAPYSLHEKTAFASVVLEPSEIENFKPTDADPLKISRPRNFLPSVEPEEAKELLRQAIDFAGKKEEKIKKYEGESLDLKGLTITEEMYPPVIKKVLQGMKSDGRKRALALILSFFTSLEFPKDFIEEKVSEWNKKNYHPLKEGYIRSQIDWHYKNKRLPPNYDKPVYKEFGLDPSIEKDIKNPINYTIRQAMRAKGREERKGKEN